MRDQTIIFFIKKLAGLFLFFRSFTNFFYRKTVCFSGIPTRFVRVEGVQADHLTTTTALKCQPNECSFCFKRQKLRFHIGRICFSLHYFCILFKGPSLQYKDEHKSHLRDGQVMKWSLCGCVAFPRMTSDLTRCLHDQQRNGALQQKEMNNWIGPTVKKYGILPCLYCIIFLGLT